MKSPSEKRTILPETAEQAESRRILERVARDSETIGTSSMARVANRVSKHFRGTENSDDDVVEVWGKRIGRILALIVFAILAYHVLTTYILHR